MENQERKEVIRDLLKKGLRLSEIQDYLIKEKNDSITYMELRLLISEMEDVTLSSEPSSKFAEPPAPAKPANRRAAGQPAPTANPQAGVQGKGKTVVSLDSVVRAGAALSGRVTFGSGAKAAWFLDAYGRVGLDPDAESSSPTQADLQEFQVELRRLLSEAQGRF